MPEITMQSNENTTEFQFLRGYTDENGTLHKTFTLRPMNGRDEEYLASKKESNNSKFLTELLSRCMRSIGDLTPSKVGGIDSWKNVIRQLTIGDIDYAMVQLRALSLGEDMTFKNICPHCGANLETVASVNELPIIEYKGDTTEVSLSQGVIDPNGNKHTDGILRVPTQADREAVDPVATKNKAKGVSLMLSRCFRFADGCPVSPDTMSEMTTKDRKLLQTVLSEDLMFGISSELELTCSECGETFNAKFDSGDFI